MLFDAEVAREYEAWYELPGGNWVSDREKAVLASQLAAFTHAKSLLEVGCGTGHFTRWFAAQGLSVTGLDASAAMLEDARRRDSRLDLVRGDAVALPFSDGSYDVVAFITALEFIADPRAALHEAVRVARQGLILGCLNRNSLLGLVSRMRGERPTGVLAAAHRYSPGELSRLVRSAGGDQIAAIDWCTALYPGRLPLDGRRLPWGEYLAMTVRLHPARKDSAA